MFSASLAGMSIGPCAAAATFAVTGNKWDVITLQHVILVGMALAVLPTLALLCFDDDQSLGPESDAVRHSYTTLREIHGQAALVVYASLAEPDHMLNCFTTFDDCIVCSAYRLVATACGRPVKPSRVLTISSFIMFACSSMFVRQLNGRQLLHVNDTEHKRFDLSHEGTQGPFGLPWPILYNLLYSLVYTKSLAVQVAWAVLQLWIIPARVQWSATVCVLC